MRVRELFALVRKCIRHLKLILAKTRIIKYSNFSFSQYGEDKIILLTLKLYKISNPNYIDIGAFHPFNLSNTALLYYNGIRGINLEPNPVLFKKFTKFRKADININSGVYKNKCEMIYYQFNKPEFNTFSEIAAKETEALGINKMHETKVQVYTYNDIVVEYLKGVPPDILFVDAEGLDRQIIESINYDKLPPKIICVETYAYALGEKDHALISLILQKGYKIHADTYVNTIFIHKSIFQ